MKGSGPVGLRNLFKPKEYSMFGDDGEGEIVNILIAFVVSLSLLLFPLPIYGLIAVGAWVFFLIVAIIRRYHHNAIAIIGFVAIMLTAYQIVVIPDHLEEERLYDDLIEVSPERGEDFQDSYEIEIDVTNDNVDKVYYDVRMGKDYSIENFTEFDFENEDTLTITGTDRRGAHTLLFIIELKEGGRTPHLEYGSYYLESSED